MLKIEDIDEVLDRFYTENSREQAEEADDLTRAVTLSVLAVFECLKAIVEDNNKQANIK